MASFSTGTSSGSSSQETLFLIEIEQKKRKRMISNRESARRSRLRKQKHLDDLIEQASQMKRNNDQILAAIDLAAQSFLSVETENSVLRTQVMELSSRLKSLNEILQDMNLNGSSNGESPHMMFSDSFIDLWSFMCMNQPILASPGMIQYY